MRRFLFICLTLGILGSVLSSAHQVRENVLRLHVLANSDSAYDQSIKLRVRDRVLADWGGLFTRCDTREDALSLAERHKGQILASAKDELRKLGCLAPVSVRMGETRFPTKTYGSVRLPRGRYTALELRIGHGDGKNWWCVMYPPLCLTDGVVTADQETMETLKQNLSADSYAMICEDTAITPRIRFKLAEILGEWL